MFSKLPNAASRRRVTFFLDGQTIEAREGDTLASAILIAMPGATRTSVVSGSSRAPYCMMGVCFECLMTVDGVSDRQACMVLVSEGMDVRRPERATELVA